MVHLKMHVSRGENMNHYLHPASFETNNRTYSCQNNTRHILPLTAVAAVVVVEVAIIIIIIIIIIIWAGFAYFRVRFSGGYRDHTTKSFSSKNETR